MNRRPYIIGITGGSGSGKTSLIRDIQANFQKTEVCIISQDDYYKPRDQQQKDKEGVHNFDLPDSISFNQFCNDIKLLIEGKSISILEYVFNNEKAVPKSIEIHPAPVIIIEGLFVFHDKPLKELMDLKVFVHAKENLKIIRRIKRDQLERNYPLDDVLYRYEHHVLPSFESFIEPYREEADLVINNNLGYDNGAEVLIGFIKNKIS
jgi:uridine kinase